MSAMGQKRTSRPSFDHLVGGSEQRRRHREAERFCSLEVEHELDLGGPHDRQVGGLLALENPPGIDADLPIGIGYAAPVAAQAAGHDGFAHGIHRRQPMTSRKRDQSFPFGVEKCAGTNKQGTCPALGERCKGWFDVGVAADIENDELSPNSLCRRLYVLSLCLGFSCVRVDEYGDCCGLGRKLEQQFESLCPYFAGEKVHACDVAARPVEAGDEAPLNRIASAREDDWYCFGCGLGRECRNVVADDYRHPSVKQISDESWQSIRLIFCRAEFNRDVLTI